MQVGEAHETHGAWRVQPATDIQHSTTGEDKLKLPAVGRVTPTNTKDDPPLAHLHAAKSGRTSNTNVTKLDTGLPGKPMKWQGCAAQAPAPASRCTLP